MSKHFYPHEIAFKKCLCCERKFLHTAKKISPSTPSIKDPFSIPYMYNPFAFWYFRLDFEVPLGKILVNTYDCKLCHVIH